LFFAWGWIICPAGRVGQRGPCGASVDVARPRSMLWPPPALERPWKLVPCRVGPHCGRTRSCPRAPSTHDRPATRSRLAEFPACAGADSSSEHRDHLVLQADRTTRAAGHQHRGISPRPDRFQLLVAKSSPTNDVVDDHSDLAPTDDRPLFQPIVVAMIRFAPWSTSVISTTKIERIERRAHAVLPREAQPAEEELMITGPEPVSATVQTSTKIGSHILWCSDGAPFAAWRSFIARRCCC